MRNKSILAYIICLVLAVGCLSSCSLFHKDQGTDTASSDQTSENSSAENSRAEDAAQNSLTPPDGSSGEVNTEGTTGSGADTELPEIEIPDAADSSASQPAGTPVSEPQPANTPVTEQEPTNTPAPEQNPGSHDLFTDEDGNIILPELP